MTYCGNCRHVMFYSGIQLEHRGNRSNRRLSKSFFKFENQDSWWLFLSWQLFKALRMMTGNS